MDLDNYHKDASDVLFGRYNASNGVSVNHRDGYGTIDFYIRFHDSQSFAQFLVELKQCQELSDERRLQKSNPVIQRAYDEYKLLLKLSQ